MYIVYDFSDLLMFITQASFTSMNLSNNSKYFGAVFVEDNVGNRSDSAFYILGGIYLDDNIGELIYGQESKWVFTPSFAIGYYDDGDGKKLGNDVEFRTTFELSYQLKNLDRIGISFGHISNANIGNKNPGVEIISLSYQKPF